MRVGAAVSRKGLCPFKWPSLLLKLAFMSRVFAVLLILVAGSALAETGRPPTQWIIDPNTKCKIANAFPSAAETLTWSGPCKDGYADGRGVAQWFKAKKITAKKYEGEMNGGFMNGQGVFTFANGDRFEGTFKDGSLNGQGKATWFNKNRYEGEWKDGYPNGTGTYVWADGKRYTGQWLNGKQNGDGDFKFPNGDHYVGQMKDGLMDGKGKLTFASGDAYIGEFRNDKANGQGTVRLYAVAVSHSGIFKDGCLKDGDEVVSIGQTTMSCALKLDKH
jgi:hypothetical protein